MATRARLAAFALLFLLLLAPSPSHASEAAADADGGAASGAVDVVCASQGGSDAVPAAGADNSCAEEEEGGRGICVAGGSEDPAPVAVPSRDGEEEKVEAALQEAGVVEQELRALEERLLAAKSMVHALAAEVGQQEERLFQLLQKLGGATQLQRHTAADLHHEGLIGGRTIHVQHEVWADHMHMRAAVRVDAEITLAEIVCGPPAKSQDFGTCHYVIVGDFSGKLYFFDANSAELGAEYATEGGSPVTAISYWPARRNTTMIATGHANGQVLLHTVHEEVPRMGPRSKNAPDPKRSAKSVEPVAAVLGEMEMQERAVALREQGVASPSDAPPGIAHLGSFRCGRMRCLAVADMAGGVGVYYENGTARNYDGRTMVNHAPLAMRAGSTVVTVVYSSGVATLPIRQGAAGMQLTVCKGLNESSMAAFVWDAVASTRGYAITEEGDTLVAIVQSAASNAVQPSKSKDGGAPIKGPMCLIRSRSSSGLPSGPLAAMHIKGYLLALSQMSVGIFNTTSVYRGTMREVLVEPLQGLARELGHPFEPTAKPVMATNRDRLVVVAFSGGVAAFYRSGLFIAKPFDMGSMKAWTQPLFVAAMILVGGYQFYRARNKSNTGKLSKGGGDVSQMLNQLPAHLRGEIEAELSNSNYGMSARRGGGAGGTGGYPDHGAGRYGRHF
eukprot:jgi/Tetstr1/431687/TSEL_021214.t1